MNRWVGVILLLSSLCFAGQADIDSAGRQAITQVRTVYSVTNVTTGAWVELVAALPSYVSELEIFDSSGQTLKIGVGSAGNEVTKLIIYPGGNGQVSLNIPAGSRVSIRAISATASAGESDINFYE